MRRKAQPNSLALQRLNLPTRLSEVPDFPERGVLHIALGGPACGNLAFTAPISPASLQVWGRCSPRAGGGRSPVSLCWAETPSKNTLFPFSLLLQLLSGYKTRRKFTSPRNPIQTAALLCSARAERKACQGLMGPCFFSPQCLCTCCSLSRKLLLLL